MKKFPAFGSYSAAGNGNQLILMRNFVAVTCVHISNHAFSVWLITHNTQCVWGFLLFSQ
jgi:hypothetical protein